MLSLSKLYDVSLVTMKPKAQINTTRATSAIARESELIFFVMVTARDTDMAIVKT